MKVSNLKLAVGVPCSFPWVPLSFFNSFIMLDRPDFEYISADNGPIDELRNNIVSKALQTDATHLLMCDVDQIYPKETITKLLAHRLPVVGGKICRRYPPFDPVMLKITDSGYQPIEGWEDDELIEVDATGTGCILYNMEVFRRLPYPWFEFIKDPDNGLVIGEDINFCQKLKAAGYKIYVDTSIEIGHLSTMVVNQATHDLYKAMKCSKEKKSAALGAIKN